MARTVVVGCKLPNGIVLENPANPGQTFELNGKNKALIVGADFATTDVDGDLWDAWAERNKDFSAVKSGAIFVAKTIADVVAIAEEYKARETGFEPMSTDGKDKRASGVKKASNKD